MSTDCVRHSFTVSSEAFSEGWSDGVSFSEGGSENWGKNHPFLRLNSLQQLYPLSFYPKNSLPQPF